MTKQTVNNMKLIILEMEKQIDHGSDFKSLKALSHSYETLLGQLDVKNEDFQGHKLTGEINAHLNSIKSINDKLESISIPYLLVKGDYFGVNHLTTTTTRLHSTISSLSRLLTLLYRDYNNNTLIVSVNKYKSEELSYKLIKKNNENIIETSLFTSGIKIITDKNTYHAFVFNEGDRGKRYKVEVAYVDENLTLDQMKLVMDEIKGTKVINSFNSESAELIGHDSVGKPVYKIK